ncbi:hypothetical protein, partial [Rhodococcoides corynebacterioides]
MTDPAAPSDTDTPEDIEQEVELTELPPDVPLAKLVILLNRSPEGEAGITFTVQGNVVSGHLVSGLRYFKHVRDKLSASGFEWLYDEQIEHYQSVATDELHFERELVRTKFVHLLNVTIYEGTQQIRLDAWRGRLDQVTGWSLGMLDRTPL